MTKYNLELHTYLAPSNVCEGVGVFALHDLPEDFTIWKVTREQCEKYGWDKIPKNVKELDLLSKDAFLQSAQRGQKIGKIAIAYTVWSTKKGGGKLIVKEVFKVIKKSNHLNRLVTLSPLTEMARNFHLRNGAVEVQINETTQNFEYIVLK